MPERVAADPNGRAPGSERVAVLVEFRNVPGPSEQALVRSRGGVIKYSYHLVPGLAASLPAQAVAALAGNPAVTHVEPDGKVYATDSELDNAWGVKRIGAGVVHAPPNSNTGLGVRVAVIDTGIDRTHPELDGNCKGGWDFVNNDDNPMDDHGHGTHVAGTIAAEDNDTGVVGVAPGAHLYALKILDSSGSGNNSDLIAAMEWAVDHSMQVVNLSLGTPTDPGSLVKQAFDQAALHGIVTVAAAGNSDFFGLLGNTVQWPARYASVIAVGATDSANSLAYFSSTGPEVELAAPGVGITSTWPGTRYASMDGTSMATPHVAGTAALVIAAGYSDVRGRLASTADDLGLPGRDTWYGYGLVDADEAAVGGSVSAPVADFSATPASGAAPLAVQFADQSTGTVSSWSWTFGDGGTSAQQNPSHTYTAAGAYTVSLTVTNSAGSDTATKTNYITVASTPAPVADFTGTPTSGPAPLAVQFTDASEGTVTGWSWSFGDETAGSTEQDPLHTYSAAGTYTVALTVTGPGGSDTATKVNYVTVTQTPPPPPPMTPYLTIVMSKQNLSKQWRALATITVRENSSSGAAIAGALVDGHWSGLYGGIASGVTDSTGKVTFQTPLLKVKGTVSFTVDGVTIEGRAYDAWLGDTSKTISQGRK